MHELALFAGAGGGILGGKLLGWRTVCAVEFASFCARRLAQRQNEGNLPSFPIWDDVRTFDGRPWSGIVDVVSGGFPCQDISSAGKGAGIEGSRSSLWAEMARIIGEVGPEWVLVENSPLLTSRGLGTVLRDLAEMGFNAEWGVLGAVDAGAPHERERIWIIANNPSNRRGEGRARGSYPSGEREREFPFPSLEHTTGKGFQDRAGFQMEESSKNKKSERPGRVGDWWATEPRLGRVAHGVAHRVDRLRAIGNGQVPAVAAMAFRILSGRLLNAPQV